MRKEPNTFLRRKQKLQNYSCSLSWDFHFLWHLKRNEVCGNPAKNFKFQIAKNFDKAIRFWHGRFISNLFTLKMGKIINSRTPKNRTKKKRKKSFKVDYYHDQHQFWNSSQFVPPTMHHGKWIKQLREFKSYEEKCWW